MEKRQLGGTAFKVAPLAFGGNVFGWTVDESGSFRLLDAFVDAGFNLIDTADSYSRWAPGHQGGESESIIGRWIARRGRHDDVVIATKVGSDMGLGRKCLSRDYIMQAVEQSLRRLQVDAIDLYQSHWDDADTPFDESLEAYARLIHQGKVRAIGASNLEAARLDLALETSAQRGLPRYETLQPLYNLYDRDTFEGPLAAAVRARKDRRDHVLLAGVWVPHRQVPLGSGFRQEPARRRHEEIHDPARAAILAALDQAAQKHRATPAQAALAWLIARPG